MDFLKDDLLSLGNGTNVADVIIVADAGLVDVDINEAPEVTSLLCVSLGFVDSACRRL